MRNIDHHAIGQQAAHSRMESAKHYVNRQKKAKNITNTDLDIIATTSKPTS